MYRSQQRKTKILFGLADILLTSAAFEIAYAVRTWLRFTNEFYLVPDVKTLLLCFCASTWVAAGYWLNVYGKLEAARIRVILRDSARQVAYSALAMMVFIVGLQQKISRPFLAIFILLTWLFLAGFRIGARNLIPFLIKGFGLKRFVL